MVCNSAYDLGLKSQNLAAPVRSRAGCDCRAHGPLFVREICEAKQEVCLKLLSGLRELQRI
jgi:hypothetical protein